MILSISLFEIIRAVFRGAKSERRPDPNIAASVADAAAINPKGTKTLLPNGVNIFFINSKATLVNGARELSNPSSGLFSW